MYEIYYFQIMIEEYTSEQSTSGATITSKSDGKH